MKNEKSESGNRAMLRRRNNPTMIRRRTDLPKVLRRTLAGAFKDGSDDSSLLCAVLDLRKIPESVDGGLSENSYGGCGVGEMFFDSSGNYERLEYNGGWVERDRQPGECIFRADGGFAISGVYWCWRFYLGENPGGARLGVGQDWRQFGKAAAAGKPVSVLAGRGCNAG